MPAEPKLPNVNTNIYYIIIKEGSYYYPLIIILVIPRSGNYTLNHYYLPKYTLEIKQTYVLVEVFCGARIAIQLRSLSHIT